MNVNTQIRKAFLREHAPTAAERIECTEAALAEVEQQETDVDELAVSFGAPSNRLRGEGFWDWPIHVWLGGQLIATVTRGDSLSAWTADSPRVRVLSAVHTSGYHGGYVTVKLAVPSGAEARHEPEARA